jgi:hypothetical protein
MTLGWNVLFMVHLFITGRLATDLSVYKLRYQIAKASEKEAALYRMAGGVAITPFDPFRQSAAAKIITRYPQAISIFSSSFPLERAAKRRIMARFAVTLWIIYQQVSR